MKNRVVVTGIGILAPDADNVSEFWSNLEDGKSSIKKITKCNTERLSIKIGGQIENCHPEAISKRLLRKCDDFSIYALIAVGEALKDAQINMEDCNPERFGIFVGNNSGGWANAEAGLGSLHGMNHKPMSPFLASNWFPAAPQGHISINYGLKGFSKTVVSDMASSTVAIGNAYRSIVNGTNDYVVAGGTESLMVNWGLIFYEKNGTVCTGEVPEEAYQPFGKKQSGTVLGEGAGFLILESLESALKRNAHIYCEICGYGMTNDGMDPLLADTSGEQYARAIRKVQKSGEIPDYVMLGGAASKDMDDSEVNGLNLAFGDRVSELTCSCPKAFYGNTYGAAGAMDTIIACLSMQNNKIIKTGEVKEPADNVKFRLVTGRNESKGVNSVLVMSKGAGGVNSSLYLRKEI